ncbi:MAG TPA: CHAD domain-containing protein [Edaphobacter sp.]|nr:CHAD domain-containing protein [Edaphobacter sp.]
MAAAKTLAYPIRSLREQVTALEAAITLCLAEPRTKPVHRLRTTTRRIEGQLAMLEVLPQVPKHRKQAGKARRLLKKLRRAAGDVRDIDVQMDLITETAHQGASEKVKGDADRLVEKLQKNRGEHAETLLKVLRKRQSEVTLALEDLLEALEPIESMYLTAMEVSELAESWYRKHVPAATKKNRDDPEYLHTIRKVAKLARYIAENAPLNAKTPRRLAEEFEGLQESGGQWHDWLVLEEIARETVEKTSALTKVFSRRSRSSLATYRRHLGKLGEKGLGRGAA